MSMDLFYEEAFEMLFEISEKMMEQKYSLESDLTMTGWAIKVNEFIEKFENENKKEEIEKKCEEIWEKWYKKIQKEQLTATNLALLKKLEEAFKNMK